MFFPRADAAVLSSGKYAAPTEHPSSVAPVYDIVGINAPIEPWQQDVVDRLFPPKPEPFAPAAVPPRPTKCGAGRYPRALLAKNEHLRLSMLWYFTRDILEEKELLSGLQEKVHLAQESSDWEYAIVGILDVNFYIRLATVNTPLGILPRGETICAHMVTQPPGSIFLLPNMLEDWRFQESPYVEHGGLKAYAGAPLRLQNESGEAVALGSLCVASATSRDPLTKSQQQTLVHLADWVVSDIVQCARARRQRTRRRMTELLASVQKDLNNEPTQESVLTILGEMYPEAIITLKSSRAAYLEFEARGPILLSDIKDGLWEDTEYLNDFLINANHQDLPSTRVVRILAAPCESASGSSLLAVATKDFRLVFDDIDLWFVESCATLVSQIWHKQLLSEAMRAKEKFLRGFSHQLRTPLHGILGSVDLLAEELKSTAKMLDSASNAGSGSHSVYLDTIKTSGRDLISIVNNMITLNRWADVAMKERTYTIEPISDLEAQLADETLGNISEGSQHQACLLFNNNLPESFNGIQTDHELFRNSLLPLLVNAFQNTPTAGTVAVTFSMGSSASELIVDVEDTGCGIAADDLERIFEPYEKVGTHTLGAGLGLTLSSKFATLLGGSVVLVSSEVGRGSHFRATFRDVECVATTPSPALPQLADLPRSFYMMSTEPESPILTDHFSKVLVRHGFTAADSPEDSFVVFVLNSDAAEHQTRLSQIPSTQVVICLVPDKAWRADLRDTNANVVYAHAPFHASKMSSLLSEADKLLATIHTSQSAPAVNSSATIQSKIDGMLNSNKNTSKLDGDGLSSKLVQPPADNASIAAPNQLELLIQQVKAADITESREPVPNVIFTPATRPAKPTALLVDDNPINLRILQMYCKKRGLPFHCAADGQQAVDIFTKHQAQAAAGGGEAIQLVLMDLQMPVCDGLEATQQLRQLEVQHGYDRSSVFIVTGQDNLAYRTASEAAGADEYFVKPVGMDKLDRSVKQYFPAFGGR